jgi:hypothetical protein
MSTDNYASEEETRALIVPDTRTPAEKHLHKLIEAESVPELCGSDYPEALYKAAVKLAGQAAQPQQEPFGYFKSEPFGWTDCAETDEGAIALYEHQPAQRKPLTDEQIDAAVEAWFKNEIVAGRQPFAKRMRAALEAAHGIKENT